MKLSRRELAVAVATAVTPIAPQAEAQTAPTDLAKTVRDANQRNSEALAKLEIPLPTEPAFQFKA